MTSDEVLSLLETHGAILRGHFVGTSGRHLDMYINKDAIYPHPGVVSILCEEIAVRCAGRRIDAVAAPVVGGVILSQWVAEWLSIREGGIEVLALYAEKDASGCFTFRRGYDRLVSGRRVLVVEDVLTTGGSLRSVIEAIRAAGGEVVGAAALVNRGGVTAEDVGFGGEAGLFVLATLDLQSWGEVECPLCRAGVPVNVEVGKGREFLERRR